MLGDGKDRLFHLPTSSSRHPSAPFRVSWLGLNLERYKDKGGKQKQCVE